MAAPKPPALVVLSYDPIDPTPDATTVSARGGGREIEREREGGREGDALPGVGVKKREQRREGATCA